MTINGTTVTLKNIDKVTQKEILFYMNYVQEQENKHGDHEEIATLEIASAPNGEVSLDYTTRPPQFQRIRRITGYLVGTLDRFNNAKRAEEHDRVKHTLSSK